MEALSGEFRACPTSGGMRDVKRNRLRAAFACATCHATLVIGKIRRAPTPAAAHAVVASLLSRPYGPRALGPRKHRSSPPFERYNP